MFPAPGGSAKVILPNAITSVGVVFFILHGVSYSMLRGYQFSPLHNILILLVLSSKSTTLLVSCSVI